MTATTYSPKLGVFETDADSAFTLPFPLGTQVPAPFAPIATATVASGATAQTSWAGLDPRHPLRVARDGQRRHHDDDLADLDCAHSRAARHRRRHVHAHPRQRLGHGRQRAGLDPVVHGVGVLGRRRPRTDDAAGRHRTRGPPRSQSRSPTSTSRRMSRSLRRRPAPAPTSR